MHTFKRSIPEYIKAIRYTSKNSKEIQEMLKELGLNFWTLVDLFNKEMLVIKAKDITEWVNLSLGDWLVLKDGKPSSMTNEDILTNWEVVTPSKFLDED
jgi:hypothetical protein